MLNIEDKLKETAERAIVKIITEGRWIEPNYNNRFKLPDDFIHSIWQEIDKEKIKQEIKEEIEKEVAKRIVSLIATELATDIKRSLSVKERRDSIRYFVNKNLDDIFKG